MMKRLVIGVKKTMPLRWLLSDIWLRLICMTGIVINERPMVLNRLLHDRDLYHYVNRYSQHEFLYFRWLGFGDW